MKKWTLAAIRTNAKLTQKEAADKLKISNKTLWSWEQGLTVPSADKIDAICELYDVAYDDINFLHKNPFKTERR